MIHHQNVGQKRNSFAEDRLPQFLASFLVNFIYLPRCPLRMTKIKLMRTSQCVSIIRLFNSRVWFIGEHFLLISIHQVSITCCSTEFEQNINLLFTGIQWNF